MEQRVPIAERVATQLRERKVRLTPQRQAILEYLQATKGHPTAEQVHDHVRRAFPGISLATVYNTLNLLVGLGLVRELPLTERSARYDGDVSNHYHVLCQGCGRIIDFHRPALDMLEDEAARATGFQITGHRIDLYGYCVSCQQARGAGAERA